jgi:Na+-transporting NADH:ubiquinone oxidoreductase subunit NqrF
MPNPDDYTMALVCGPPVMNLGIGKMLKSLGHCDERVFGFGTSDF